MKPRLDLYLLRETVTPFLIGAIACVLLLAGGLLFEYGRMFFDRNVSLVAVAQLLLYRLPFLTTVAAPVAVAVGTAMAVNRLARDQEILVMRMAGVSVRRLFLPYLLLGVVLFGLTYWFQESVAPNSGKAFKKVLFQIALMQTQPRFAPGLVIKAQDYHLSFGMVERLPDGSHRVQDFVAIRRTGTHKTEIWHAPEAVYRDGVFHLTRPAIWRLDANNRLETYTSNATGRIDRRVPLTEIIAAPQPDELRRSELREQIETERATGRNVAAKEVQYHAKLAIPFACIIFALFGPVLSLVFARSGGYTGILLSVVVVFAHINLLLLFTKILGEPGILPPVVAAWAPNGLFLLIALVAMVKVE
jgi:lipopolysaccharide export system permease protein